MRKIVPFNNVLTFNTDVYEITAISLEHDLNKEKDELSGVFYISGEYKIMNGGINAEKFSFELPFDIALGTRYDMDSMVVDIDDFRYELIDKNKMKVNIDLYIDGEEVIQEVSIESLDDVRSDEQEEVENEMVKDIKQEHLEEVNNSKVVEKNELDSLLEEEIGSKLEEEVELSEVKETMENDIKRESEIVKEFIYDETEQEGKNVSNTNIEINNYNENNILNSINNEENFVTYKVYRIVEGDTIDSILTKYKVSKEELLSYNDNINDLKVGDKLIIPYK